MTVEENATTTIQTIQCKQCYAENASPVPAMMGEGVRLEAENPTGDKINLAAVPCTNSGQ
jgi:hypothetical protein